jgi:cytochrome c oxidase subunit II
MIAHVKDYLRQTTPSAGVSMRLKRRTWIRAKQAVSWRAGGAWFIGALIPVAGAACAQIGSSDPVTDQGRIISDLFNLELVLALLLFLLVGGLLTTIIMRFRGRPGDADPPQVTGNRKLEVTWTLLPVLVLACLFVLTVRTMNAVDAASAGELPIQVIGHQWWWEFQYPGQGIVAANELHVPVDAPLRLDLTSADVIHSFWLPQFGWMQDNVPGKTNQMRVRVNQVGDYIGACTQFCGVEHARMQLHVSVESRDQFNAWLQQQRQPAAAPTSAAAAHGQQVFQQLTCANCHVIQGTSARGRVGPDLTHLASRATIGAGVLDNTPDNLRRWVKDAQGVKAGVLMPSFPNLSDADLSDLTNYLEGLK